MKVTITPLQLALFYSAFAAGGTIPQPQLFRAAEPAPGKEYPRSCGGGDGARSLVETLHGLTLRGWG